jgi:pimeloyl-ACP methyl ester carboxylesterase
MDHVVDDLGRVADAVSPDAPLVLAGLSFGGLASLHFTLKHPERVRALVLAGSGPGFKNPKAAAAWKQQSERTATHLEERGLEAFVSGRAASTCVGRRPELPAAQAAAEAIRAQDPHGLAEFGRHVAGLAPSVIDDLAHIAQPALVVVGEEDEAYLQAAEVMAAKLPAARHRLLPHAGHILNIEETEAFNAMLIGFLREIEVIPG